MLDVTEAECRTMSERRGVSQWTGVVDGLKREGAKAGMWGGESPSVETRGSHSRQRLGRQTPVTLPSV